MTTPNAALLLAISRLDPPTQAELARLIGRKPQQVNRWLRKGQPLPSKFCLIVERATGVSRYVLRPDVFGAEPEGETKEQG